MRIRRSQFIRTYGPGAVIETPKTPAIILSFDTGNEPSNFLQKGYLIRDPVLENYLKSIIKKYGNISDLKNLEVKIFELPFSSEGKNVKFSAKNFQKWYLCPEHRILWKYDFKKQKDCPFCKGDVPTRSTPVRFIQACKNGHLDDIQWDDEVHTSYINDKRIRKKCNSTYFRWEGPGTGTSETKIVCVECGQSIKLSDLYNRELKCTGRFPEKEKPRDGNRFEEECTESAAVVLRMASNLRIPETESIFMVWPRSNEVGSILASNIAMSARILQTIKFYEQGKLNSEELKSEFNKILEEVKISKNISEDEYEKLKKNEKNILSLKKYLEEVERMEKKEYSYRDIVDMEYRNLQEGATAGKLEDIPETGRKYLEINSTKTIRRNFLSVTPIDILTVIETQVAYRRLDISSGKPVLIHKEGDDGTYFFPSIMINGEGIFFDFNQIKLNEKEPAFQSWLEAFKNRHIYSIYDNEFLFKIKKEKYELHPIFVFLHTFAHLLIKALSLYSGYSITSIKEKIYVTDVDTDNPSGGIVLYTATEDEGGALGGLVSLVEENKLKKIFTGVINVSRSCSNDPVCTENRFNPGKYAGASCYSCIAISETSCDHRNLWLDRNLFNENANLLIDWL